MGYTVNKIRVLRRWVCYFDHCCLLALYACRRTFRQCAHQLLAAAAASKSQAGNEAEAPPPTTAEKTHAGAHASKQTPKDEDASPAGDNKSAAAAAAASASSPRSDASCAAPSSVGEDGVTECDNSGVGALEPASVPAVVMPVLFSRDVRWLEKFCAYSDAEETLLGRDLQASKDGAVDLLDPCPGRCLGVLVASPQGRHACT